MGTGLDLSRVFFLTVKDRFSSFFPSAAFGLVGEGSECLGFDDEISRDHDFGPAFCVWLPEAELESARPALERIISGLPKAFEQYPTRFSGEAYSTGPGRERTGVQGIETFYRKYTGLSKAPHSWQEWLRIPEHFLAVCTNGEVFMDERGIFTAHRNALLAFYPEDVRRKKLASRCMEMAQSGQYNLYRCLKRSDAAAALQCASRFSDAAMSAVFLLNRRYTPFYKWACRGMRELPVLGGEAASVLDELASTGFGPGKEDVEQVIDRLMNAVDGLCIKIIHEMKRQGISRKDSPHMIEHVDEVQAGISVPELRAYPLP